MHAHPPIAPCRDPFHESLERLETDVQAKAPWSGSPWPEPRAGW
jgi:hypothetical protein